MNKFNECVSIISPCYNGEKYIDRFLKSVLNQTYPNIELIFVDDASIDSTESIAKSYIDRFKEKGYSLVVVKQKENKGQAAAINVGLKLFRGDFIAWIDSDDMYYPNAIEDRVLYLNNHPEFDFVLGQGEVVDADDIYKRKGVLRRLKPEKNDNLFKDLLDETNVVFGPGTILVRTESLRKAIPTLSIYESREGQNWQLMLPLAYNCKYGYIDDVQFKYVVHNDSHSHTRRSYEQLIIRRKNFNFLQKETIKAIPNMSDQDRKQWLEYVDNKCLYFQCLTALQHIKLGEYFKYKKILSSRAIDRKYFNNLSIIRLILGKVFRMGRQTMRIIIKHINVNREGANT